MKTIAKNTYTKEQRKQVLAMIAAGNKTHAEIGEATGVHRNTVSHWVIKYGTVKHRRQKPRSTRGQKKIVLPARVIPQEKSNDKRQKLIRALLSLLLEELA